tara:strand:- start:50 stop:886 length:837 start_codon:yes stop_codon:yes gene_type:complete
MKLAELASNNQPPKPSGEPKIEAKMKVKTWPALHMLFVDFPKAFVDELNTFIDEVIIPSDKDYSHSLVGQVRQDEKSKQLMFPMDEHEFAVEFKKILDSCATNYIQQAYKKQSHAETYDAWTVHSYAGDYNPRHSHGVATPAGLSSLMWLKVPDCIKNLKSSVDANTGLNHASGLIDGWTQFTWELNSSQDLFRMKCQSQEAVQPAEGRLLIWPNWLDHEVFPFFGEGERRTFVANFNIFDSIQEKEKYSNVLKEHNKQRKETSSRIKDRIMVAKIDE